MNGAKTAEPIEMPFGLWTRVGQLNNVLDGVQIPHGNGRFSGGRFPLLSIGTVCRDLCMNG